MNRLGQNDFLEIARSLQSGVNAAFVAKMRSMEKARRR